MPHFYFDTNDGKTLTKDVYGIELPDVQAARKVAVATLPDMARDVPIEEDNPKMAVHVKDEAGGAVVDVTLKLEVEINAATSSPSRRAGR